MCKVYKLFLFTFLIVACNLSIANNLKSIEIPDSGIELGMGWDSIKSTAVPNRCIVFAPVQSTGQKINMDLSKVESYADLASSLKVSVTASAKGFGSKASATGSFVHDQKFSSKKEYFALHVEIQNGVLFTGPQAQLNNARYSYPVNNQAYPVLKNITETTVFPQGLNSLKLTDEAADALGKGQVEFRALCGDSFVFSIRSGAELLATIEHDSMSKEDNEKIEANLKASYGGTASVEASAAQSKDKLQQDSHLTYNYYQNGGGQTAIPASQSQFEAKLSTIAIEAANTPVFFDAYVMSYSQLLDYKIDGADSKDIKNVEALAVIYHQLLSTKNIYDQAINDYNAYYAARGLEFFRYWSTELSKIIYDIGAVIDTKPKQYEFKSRWLTNVTYIYDGQNTLQSVIDAIKDKHLNKLYRLFALSPILLESPCNGYTTSYMGAIKSEGCRPLNADKSDARVLFSYKTELEHHNYIYYKNIQKYLDENCRSTINQFCLPDEKLQEVVNSASRFNAGYITDVTGRYCLYTTEIPNINGSNNFGFKFFECKKHKQYVKKYQLLKTSNVKYCRKDIKDNKWYHICSKPDKNDIWIRFVNIDNLKNILIYSYKDDVLLATTYGPNQKDSRNPYFLITLPNSNLKLDNVISYPPVMYRYRERLPVSSSMDLHNTCYYTDDIHCRIEAPPEKSSYYKLNAIFSYVSDEEFVELYDEM